MASQIARALPAGVANFKPDRAPDNRQRSNRFLKRKISLRDGFIRKLKKEGTRVSWNRNGAIKKRKPLKKISRSLRERMKEYIPLAKEFLARPENKWCWICTIRREAGENILINLATEVHHWALRCGRLICYVPYFRASCYRCREFPHTNTKRARALGVLAPEAICGVFPDEGKINPLT